MESIYFILIIFLQPIVEHDFYLYFIYVNNANANPTNFIRFREKKNFESALERFALVIEGLREVCLKRATYFYSKRDKIHIHQSLLCSEKSGKYSQAR